MGAFGGRGGNGKGIDVGGKVGGYCRWMGWLVVRSECLVRCKKHAFVPWYGMVWYGMAWHVRSGLVVGRRAAWGVGLLFERAGGFCEK